MGRKFWRIGLGLYAIIVASPSRADAESFTAAGPGGWEFSGGLYGWATWVEGNVTTRGQTFDVYADPIDLIDALDFGIMGNMEASRGRFSFLADAIYTKFSGADDVLGERNPIGNLTVNARGRVGLDYELGIYQAGALFEVASLPSPRSRTTFEFGGGARWVTQEVNVNLALDVTATRNIDQRVDRLEDRIQRIDNEEERLETLEHFNELRQEILKRRIVSAKSARILKRRVDRLETRLARVERRGEIIEALEELEALRVDLLDRRIALADRDIHGNFAMARSGQMDWVDPVVAARVTHQFGNGQSLALLGDIGGFNASSDLTWQVLLSYQKDGKLFGWDTTTILGYRALGLLFEETTQHGTRGVDVVLHGPFAELAFRW